VILRRDTTDVEIYVSLVFTQVMIWSSFRLSMKGTRLRTIRMSMREPAPSGTGRFEIAFGMHFAVTLRSRLKMRVPLIFEWCSKTGKLFENRKAVRHVCLAETLHDRS
jgi:hypothetical protein